MVHQVVHGGEVREVGAHVEARSSGSMLLSWRGLRGMIELSF